MPFHLFFWKHGASMGIPSIQPHKITILYSEADISSTQIKPLARELKARGHSVNLRKQTDTLSIAGLRDIAEQGFQRITDTVRDALQQSRAKQNAPSSPFDEIGPQQTSSESDAVITTDVQNLTETPYPAFKIGLIPQTILNKPWLPGPLDAIVISHDAFRPYLNQSQWDDKQIFTGGYLPEENDHRSDSPENLRSKFGISSENGPVILVLAGDIPAYQLTSIFIQLSSIKLPFQVFFHHGDNHDIAQQLRSLAQRFGINARMFGNINPLADYIGIADIAITMAGDPYLGSLETLAIPTLTIEERDPQPLAQFLQHEGASIAVQQFQFSGILQNILLNPDELTKLKTAAANVAACASVQKCADAIEEALRNKSEIAKSPLRQNAVPLAQNGFEVIGMTNNANAGGFESIGGNNQQATPANNADVPQLGAEMPASPANAQPNALQPPAQQPLQPPVQRPLTPTYNVLQPAPTFRTRDSIQAEMTQLILIDKNLDKQLDEVSAEVSQFEMRLDMARQNNDENLIRYAQQKLEAAQAREKALFQQKSDIQRQKELLKRATQVSRHNPSYYDDESDFRSTRFTRDPLDELENRFEELERRNKLSELHRRLRRDFDM